MIKGKDKLIVQFAERVTESLIAAGYITKRSSLSVSVEKLSEMTGHTPQMCRKYIRGTSYPKYTIIYKIAINLNVSPGWLAFGAPYISPGNDVLVIRKELLQSIFVKTQDLHTLKQSEEEITAFLIQLVNVAGLISSNEEAEKVIDLLISNRMERPT